MGQVVYRNSNGGGYTAYNTNGLSLKIYKINPNLIVKNNPFDHKQFSLMKYVRHNDGSVHYEGNLIRNGKSSRYRFFDNGRVIDLETGQRGYYSPIPESNKFKFTWDKSTPLKPVVNSDEKPEGTNLRQVNVTGSAPTTRVGGFKINDGILPSSGLFIDKAPEVDMLRPIENSDTDSVVFKLPTRLFIQLPSTLNISAPTEGLNVQKVYNKKDTRSWLWSQGIDPYTLTGRQRRKIRNDLNTTGTTNFKINGTPIAKKGSKLIKKEEVCPKCGKVHKAGIGCTLAKFKAAKCGAKMKKHELGGSLNGISFYLEGTPKDGIKTNSLKKYTVEDINNYLSWRANDRPLTDFERFLTFRLGLPEKLVTSEFTFPELPSLYNIFSTFKLQHQQESLQKLYKNPEDRIKIIGHKNVTKHQEGTIKGGISTVPKVEDTYKKSLKFTHVDNPKYPINTDVVFPFNPLDSLQPKRDNFEIRRTIFYHQNQPNDTIYSETPNYPSLNQKDLKNRFNTAWNLAK